jgi:hypothetical protein
MDNGLIFPYHVAPVTTDGVTGKARGTLAKVAQG